MQKYNIYIDKNDFLNPKLRRLLCNCLIQSHFVYGCISWYPLVSQKLGNKIKATENKYIRFCLKLKSRHQ